MVALVLAWNEENEDEQAICGAQKHELAELRIQR